MWRVAPASRWAGSAKRLRIPKVLQDVCGCRRLARRTPSDRLTRPTPRPRCDRNGFWRGARPGGRWKGAPSSAARETRDVEGARNAVRTPAMVPSPASRASSADSACLVESAASNEWARRLGRSNRDVCQRQARCVKGGKWVQHFAGKGLPRGICREKQRLEVRGVRDSGARGGCTLEARAGMLTGRDYDHPAAHPAGSELAARAGRSRSDHSYSSPWIFAGRVRQQRRALGAFSRR